MVETEVKEDFVKHIASTLDWGALCKAASEARYVGFHSSSTYIYINILKINIRIYLVYVFTINSFGLFGATCPVTCPVASYFFFFCFQDCF